MSAGSRRATNHDVLATYLPLIKHAAKFSNAGFSGPEAAEAVASGKLDGVFFGILYIANPDLAKRLEEGKELNQNFDFKTFYGLGGDLEDQKKGYTDYPFAT